MEADTEEVWNLSWESLVEKEGLYISYSGMILYLHWLTAAFNGHQVYSQKKGSSATETLQQQW